MGYVESRRDWIDAGRPVRTDDEVKLVWDICSGEGGGDPCPLFQWVLKRKGWGRCLKCGCALNLGKKLNKLYWATEGCPRRRSRRMWPAKVIKVDGEWIANPDWKNMVDEKPEKPEKETREQRIKRREKEKLARIAKRATKAENRKLLGRHQELINVPINEDSLQIFDRNANLIPVSPLKNLWWPANGAFLVCGGPSINKLPYKMLADPRVMSIGVNNVAGWVPVKAQTFSDPTEKFSGHTLLNPGIMKLVPVPKLKNQIRLKHPDTGEFVWGPLRLRDCPNVFAFQRKTIFEPARFLEDTLCHWGGEFAGHKKILYTPFLAYRLLVHFGIKNIFLLGVDHMMDEDSGYSFPQDRHTGAIKSNNRHYQIINEALRMLRPYFEAKGVNVYNCNPDSHCPAWDHVPFDQAFETCVSMIPPHPLNLSGWYNKNGDGKSREDDDQSGD